MRTIFEKYKSIFFNYETKLDNKETKIIMKECLHEYKYLIIKTWMKTMS